MSADLMRPMDVYALARFFAERTEAYAIIDANYQGGATANLNSTLHVRVDLDQILAVCRDGSPKILIGADAKTGRRVEINEAALDRSVIVCANGFERLHDPSRALACLSQFARRASAVIVTVAEAAAGKLLNDADHSREGRNVLTVELEGLLDALPGRPTFTGLTRGLQSRLKDTFLTIFDRCAMNSTTVPDAFRPLAIMATYNDEDLAPQVMNDFLDGGIEVHVLDNWSTDETFERLVAISAARGGAKVERFPINGPTMYYEWRAILEKKEELAWQFPGRWIIHHDSDELRRSPWPEISLRAGMYVADRMGFNAIDFTVCNFRSIDDTFTEGMNPETAFRYFEFGKEPGHFSQVKAWRQGKERVRLAFSGGHEADFSARRIFPYKFLLKHYPLRNRTQARQKIISRLSRFDPQELALGWHSHYSKYTAEDLFLWNPSELIEFDERKTRHRFLTEMISGIGIMD